MIAWARRRTPSRRKSTSPSALTLRRVSSRDMLSSAIVVFSVSSVSDFQRREDDAVAVLVHGPRCYTKSGDTTRTRPRPLASEPSGTSRENSRKARSYCRRRPNAIVSSAKHRGWRPRATCPLLTVASAARSCHRPTQAAGSRPANATTQPYQGPSPPPARGRGSEPTACPSACAGRGCVYGAWLAAGDGDATSVPPISVFSAFRAFWSCCISWPYVTESPLACAASAAAKCWLA